MKNNNQDSKSNYNHLVSIFLEYLNNLDEQEKNELLTALLAYNSQLFIPINKIKEIPDYKNKTYEEIIDYIFQEPNFKIIRNIWNNFLKLRKNQESFKEKYPFMAFLDLKNFETYINSLINICDVIDRHVGKIITDIDIILYRGYNTEKGKNSKELSRGEYISTSTQKWIASDFAKNKWYETDNGLTIADTYKASIMLKAGSPFMIFPNPFKEDQFEVLIFKSTLHQEIISEERIKDIYSDIITRNYICTPKYNYEKKDHIVTK